ncbi:unnamed protein product [Mytilus edulis]|uniref:Uncharacterized protein n=1 Tax=Mytilus edulis TaxID=6550 RepID=A0A8S3VPH3_MYTED|nr:unnamed protein product [Mytilus edulis]
MDSEISNCKDRIGYLEQSVQFLSDVKDEHTALKTKVDYLSNGIESTKTDNKIVRDKIESIESQSLQQNLLFFAIEEKFEKVVVHDEEKGGATGQKGKTVQPIDNEICVETILDFCEKKLAIKDAKTKIKLERAYRLGKPSAEATKPRPIVVKFCEMSDREYVRSVSSRLKDTNYGRNVPLNVTVQDDCNLYNPNPRDISRKLMQRKEFIPATSINILIAGWVQFMIHDWFGSGPNDKSRHFEVPVKDDDPDFTTVIKINRTRPDNCTRLPGVTTKICKNFPRDFEFCKDAKDYETHQNINTHWWDASQLYGVDATTNNRIRSKMDGKLQLTADNRLPIDSYNGLPVTGLAIDWWVGLGMFHIIWTREHNYVCDMLKQRNPTWDDDKLYHTARLIIGGVIAKIHTLEWTPAILQNKLVSLGLRSNWYGVSLMEFAKGNSTLAKILTDIIPTLANGIPGSVGKPKNMRDVPYSITQDFIAVYRLHPLMPDTFNIRNHLTGAIENSYQMQNVVFEKTEKVFQENSLENLFYSFGNDHPGAMTLHNYPNFLRNLTLPPTHPHGAGRIDLATIDILRDRERGVPRVALPEGFGFSDTFFRIFLVMARRRLEADRFFTDYYTPEFYTQWGLDYIDRTYLKDILLRHYPTLSSQLQPNVTNVFIPWKSQTTLDKKFPYPDW